jgi:AcrR family transcriptional regulator
MQTDRRSRRRQDTIDEILEVSLELMDTEGVAALSLSAVARRVGMQPPSLYQYFPSKMAIYDALFRRGSEQLLAAQREALAANSDVQAQGRAAVTALCRWSMENQVYSQLMFWRTVPGFVPSEEAFAPSREGMESLRANLQEMAASGLLDPAAASDEGLALVTSLVAGLVSQQLANEPDASFEDGRFTRLLPTVLDMFAAWYQPRGKTCQPSSP